jgi:hypothetical protein
MISLLATSKSSSYRNKLQYFIDGHNWYAQIQHGLPFSPIKWGNCKECLEECYELLAWAASNGTYCEERNVEDGKVKSHAQCDGTEKEGILPHRQNK